MRLESLYPVGTHTTYDVSPLDDEVIFSLLSILKGRMTVLESAMIQTDFKNDYNGMNYLAPFPGCESHCKNSTFPPWTRTRTVAPLCAQTAQFRGSV